MFDKLIATRYRYYIGFKPNCTRAPCPLGTVGEYQPNCVGGFCEKWQAGIWPNCYNFTYLPPVWNFTACDDGLVGSYPHCHPPCEQYCK